MPEGTHQTVLAFDFGKRKIGIACGNTLTATSSPLDVLPMQANAPDWSGIASCIEAWKPAVLVVGLPLNMDGTESAMSQQAREFARALHNRHRLPVWMMDERLSTREAREQSVRSGRKAGTAVDALAAQRVLESWLAEPDLARAP